MVKIYTRDINGKRNIITLAWDEVCSYITKHEDELEDEEILLITYDDMCLYCQLGNNPINTDDITGFFA